MKKTFVLILTLVLAAARRMGRTGDTIVIGGFQPLIAKAMQV